MSEDLESYPANKLDIAKPFSERELFHDPGHSAEVLGIDSLAAGTKVLEVGSGKGNLVDLMKEKGVEAYGIDLPQAGLSQKADVAALSESLPFADDSMDVVVNYWGGLSYPLHEVDGRTEVENKKIAAQVFTKELSEAIRVSRDEVRIHPWSADGFYEMTGMVVVDGEDGQGLFAIDFRKALSETGVEQNSGNVDMWRTGVKSLKYGTIHIGGTEGANVSPLDKLSEQIGQTDRQIFYSHEDLAEKFPDMTQSMDRVRDLQGARYVLVQEITNLQREPAFVHQYAEGYLLLRDDPDFVGKDTEGRATMMIQESKRKLEEVQGRLDIAKGRFVASYMDNYDELIVNS